MYPKVKVRVESEKEEEDNDRQAEYEHNWSSLLSLKDIPFLLLQDSCFPVKEYRDVSPPPIARIPTSYAPNLPMPTESASEGLVPELANEFAGADKKSHSVEENRPNIRASSVPRPRAVISSPDNDALIANKNRVKPARPSALKNHNSTRSRHSQCKVVPSEATDETAVLYTRKSKDIGGSSATALSGQKRHISTAKPSCKKDLI